AFLWRKRQEMAEQPKGISENIDLTLYRAYSNVCRSEVPVKTLKEFSQIKGVGKWILRLMQEYFKADSGTSEPQDLSEKGKKAKGTKRYMPQKNSVAYALLIALYRGTATGSDFMGKQDLIMQLKQVGFHGPEKEKENVGILEVLLGNGIVDGAA
ncbi:Crossover junction endonuclease MUS81, partial [Vitis vinifera]